MVEKTTIEVTTDLRDRLRGAKREVGAEYPEAEVRYEDVLHDLLDMRDELLDGDADLEDVHHGHIIGQ